MTTAAFLLLALLSTDADTGFGAPFYLAGCEAVATTDDVEPTIACHLQQDATGPLARVTYRLPCRPSLVWVVLDLEGEGSHLWLSVFTNDTGNQGQVRSYCEAEVAGPIDIGADTVQVSDPPSPATVPCSGGAGLGQLAFANIYEVPMLNVWWRGDGRIASVLGTCRN